MITAWRLVKYKYRAAAFDGEGSYRIHGRWHTAGVRMVYTSESQALASLETLANFDPNEIPGTFAFVPVEFAPELIDPLGEALPPNWATMKQMTATLGTVWASSSTPGCVLKVPSALVPHGFNYLFKPQHPKFAEVQIGAAIPFNFDGRLVAPPGNP